MARLILVAERSPAARAQVTAPLLAAGFEVGEAASGHEALRLARDAALAILGELWLPDGFEVLRQLRARPATRQLPVIMLLPAGNEPAWAAARAAGASDVAPWPPASEAALLALVTGALD